MKINNWTLTRAENYLVVKTPTDKENKKKPGALATVCYLPLKNPRVGEQGTAMHAALITNLPALLTIVKAASAVKTGTLGRDATDLLETIEKEGSALPPATLKEAMGKSKNTNKKEEIKEEE